MTSSDSDETNGMIMMPMTMPAASALSDEMPRPIWSPVLRSMGATMSAAKNPYTTVGIPARISRIGLAVERNR